MVEPSVPTILWRAAFLRVFRRLYMERKASLPSVNVYLGGGLATRGYTTHDVDLVITRNGFSPRDDTWDSEYNRKGMFGSESGFERMFGFIDELGYRVGKRIDVFSEAKVSFDDPTNRLILLIPEHY